MSTTKHGLPGVYNESLPTLGDGLGAALAVDVNGKLLINGAVSAASPEGTNTATNISGTNWSSDTFTGAGEQNSFDQVGVSLQTDEAGTVFFDFSVDGTNWTTFPVVGFAVTAGVHEFHTAIKLGRYFRPRFVGTGGRTYFRLYTYYGNAFLPSNAPVSQALGADNDAVTVRNASDHKLDLARGFIGGQSPVAKSGANPSITSSSTEDITFSGVINWLQAATTVRIKAGGDANDTAAGTGAQSITVMGLDENWDEAEEDIVTAGASASSVTTTTFIRVYDAYVKDVGTYTGANTGNIVIENGSGGTDLLTIGAGKGESESSEFTIPAGKTGYLTRAAADVDAGKAADMIMWQRQNADDVSTPFSGKRIVIEFPQLIGMVREKFDSYRSFPAKTDLWWTGTTGSGSAPSVQADYDLVLVDN